MRIDTPSVTGLLRTRHMPQVGRRIVGGFFLWTGGIHVGILSADPRAYLHFADESPFGFVRQGWADVFMAQPRAWALALAAAETAAGILLLTRGRGVAAGWCAVIAFHCLLLLFGFGFWLWAVPVLLLLCTLAWADRAEWRRGTSPSAAPVPAPVPERVGHAQ